MGMMKARKPKRYAAGGMMDTSNFPRVSNMPDTGYVAGRDPEYRYFQENPSLTAQGAVAPAVSVVVDDPSNVSVGGAGGDSGGGTGGDSGGGDGGSGGDGGGGYAKGGAVKAKKMAKGGVVKSKMGRGDGCAVRGKTKGTMR